MISHQRDQDLVVVEAKYTELAVRALHDGFGLDKSPADRRSDL